MVWRRTDEKIPDLFEVPAPEALPSGMDDRAYVSSLVGDVRRGCLEPCIC